MQEQEQVGVEVISPEQVRGIVNSPEQTEIAPSNNESRVGERIKYEPEQVFPGQSVLRGSDLPAELVKTQVTDLPVELVKTPVSDPRAQSGGAREDQCI
jgi:hypothetical protein